MLVVEVGYAGGERRDGLAYARIAGAGVTRLIRRSFRVPEPGDDRAAAYGALTAIAAELTKGRRRGICFVISDALLAAQINNRSEVPEPLAIAYVRLRCALNAIGAGITVGPTDELTQRARAEIALNVAA